MCTVQAGITTTNRRLLTVCCCTMIIPQSSLSKDALLGVIKEFVLREGTEYGASDVSLDTKVKQVQRQLDRGDVVIVFDQESESIDIVSKNSQRYRTLLVQAAE
jgi:uncharacterized protein YheU (UPF0270 family)